MQELLNDLLIPEIFDLISKNLSQFDLISLSTTCRELHQLSIAELYRSVTVDSKFNQFENAYLEFNTTFIKSRANVMHFLKSLNNKNPTTEFNLWQLIKEFTVINLPSEFYDFESFLLGTIQNESFFLKTRLSSLSLNSPVSFNVLKQLLLDKYSRENLNKLEFNINPHASTKPIHDLIDYLNDGDSIKFQNLRKFAIGPFKQNINIIQILNLVINNNLFSNLKELKLVSQHKTLRLPDYLEVSQTQVPNSNYIFDSLYKFESLLSLSLNSFNLNQSHLTGNPAYLRKLEFMENLEFLELSDIGLITPTLGGSILHTLYQFNEQCKLKYLKLDIRTPGDDNVPAFIKEHIPGNQLKELDVVIRSNSMQSTSLDQLIDMYVLVIQRHNLSLEKLSIELKSEKNLINLEEQMQKEHLSQLLTKKFPKLRSLRIQIQFTNLIISKNELFKSMPNLQNIWVVGSNAVPVHFGLGIVHPGVYDQWWRMISLPKSLTEGISTCIEYIKIDSCLFKVNNNTHEKLEPIDCVDDLFDSLTRVEF